MREEDVRGGGRREEDLKEDVTEEDVMEAGGCERWVRCRNLPPSLFHLS